MKFHPEYASRKHPAWNKGLTKETSYIVASIAIKAGKSLKGKSHPLSKEARERLSEIQSRYLDHCSGGFSDIGWYKVKNLNGVEFTVRGYWEENVVLKLNKDNVLWVRNHSLKYVKGEIRKTYNPDFYLPNSNAFVEVKGYYSVQAQEKMRLVLEQNDITLYFIGQYHYRDFINGRINLTELRLNH